jgi:hypothetical protein
VEQKEHDSIVAAQWRNRLSQERFTTWAALGWLNSGPYGNAQAYAIAGSLGVEPDQLPCLVLFDTPHRQEKLIIPVNEVSPRFFRNLFAGLNRTIEAALVKDNARMSAFAAIEEAFNTLIGSLDTPSQMVPSPTMNFSGYTVFINRPLTIPSSSEVLSADRLGKENGMSGDSFSFDGGTTTFINRPTNTVISDFQKDFLVGAAPEDRDVLQKLEELVRLLMTTHDLPDSEKEAAVQGVHEVANQVKEKKGNSLTLRGALAAIKDIVATAADIAGPAVTLVTAISLLL